MPEKKESTERIKRKICPTFEQRYTVENRLSLTYPPSEKAFVYTTSGTYRVRLLRAAAAAGVCAVLLRCMKKHKKRRAEKQILRQYSKSNCEQRTVGLGRR